MSLSVDDIAFLQSRRGQHLLDRLHQEDLTDYNILPLVTQLRKDHTQFEVHAAITTAGLRQRAVAKFGDAAERMLFTDAALQQASDRLVRQYRAAQFEGVNSLLDICCGIGADSLAYAAVCDVVLGLDIDPVRVVIARHNADMLGFKHLVIEQQDVTKEIPSGYDAIFFDPARRDANGRRIFNVEQYIPPLSLVHDWQAPAMAVKLSPGVDVQQLNAYGGQLEFLSVAGELKEAVLWLDDRKHPPATLLNETDCLHWDEQLITDASSTQAPLRWLIEPDPALIRAGLVANVARRFAGHQMDASIAYFTCEDRPASPWIRSWEILDWMPFHLKRLRRYLLERHVGTVTVKKRGSPITPEQLQAKLKLKGDNSRTLILTKFEGRAVVLICADFALKDCT